jgi:formamidopyrimidine-DNA glycosylase
LVGRKSGAVRRHGKRLGWELGRDALLLHFGMTGFFVLRPARAEAPPLARAGFVFGRNTVWFVDGRRFGCVVPIGADELDLALGSGQGRMPVSRWTAPGCGLLSPRNGSSK